AAVPGPVQATAAGARDDQLADSGNVACSRSDASRAPAADRSPTLLQRTVVRGDGQRIAACRRLRGGMATPVGPDADRDAADRRGTRRGCGVLRIGVPGGVGPVDRATGARLGRGTPLGDLASRPGLPR